jgi:hypothetical protein
MKQSPIEGKGSRGATVGSYSVWTQGSDFTICVALISSYNRKSIATLPLRTTEII